MSPENLFQHDSGEPLELLVRETAPPARIPEARCLGVEFTSRGDRVPGRLLLPLTASEPPPVVILQHGAHGSKEADYLDVSAGPWVQRGAAVASIDFPLHGERASEKLSQRVLETLAPDRGSDPLGARLWVEFVHQAVIDLRRTLDALEQMADVDARRTTYAGFSLGTILGVPFCAADPRPRAAALAIGGGGFGPPEVDPVRHVGRIAPRPVLFVNATRDERIPRAAAEALHEAARDPKHVYWFEATHSELPGVALKAMWTFLASHLEIPPSGRAP
jgi:dienelactone hydrolase